MKVCIISIDQILKINLVQHELQEDDSQDGTLIVNGIPYVHESMSFPTEFATYPFTKNMIGKKKITQYVLNLSDNNVDSVKDELKNSDFRANPVTITIHANPKTRMLFVKIEGDVHDGIGLLGNPFAKDQLLGRDGVTDMSYDWNTYGEEWQVKDTEPKLFQELRAPQYPETCIYYASDNGHMKKTHNLRRRLLNDAEGGIVMVSKEAANDACADYVGAFKENCIYDVMIMGDLEVAEDPSYMGQYLHSSMPQGSNFYYLKLIINSISILISIWETPENKQHTKTCYKICLYILL